MVIEWNLRKPWKFELILSCICLQVAIVLNWECMLVECMNGKWIMPKSLWKWMVRRISLMLCIFGLNCIIMFLISLRFWSVWIAGAIYWPREWDTGVGWWNPELADWNAQNWGWNRVSEQARSDQAWALVRPKLFWCWKSGLTKMFTFNYSNRRWPDQYSVRLKDW